MPEPNEAVADYEDDLFNEDSEYFVEPNDEDEEILDAEETEKPNKQDPKRFEYWQSKATQVENQLRQVQPYMQVVEVLQKNPGAIQAMQDYFNQQGGEEKREQKALKAPQKPERPKDFNPYDDDPESPSVKYIRDFEDYKAEMEEYRTQMVEQRLSGIEEKTRPVEEMFQRQERLRAEQQQAEQIKQALMSEKNWTPELADGFVRWSSDPKAFSELPDFYLWQMKKAEAKNKKAKEFEETTKNQFGRFEGKGTKRTSPDEAFNQSIGQGIINIADMLKVEKR